MNCQRKVNKICDTTEYSRMPLSFKDMLLLQESAIVAKFKFQKDEPADKKLHLKMIFFSMEVRLFREGDQGIK